MLKSHKLRNGTGKLVDLFALSTEIKGMYVR